MNDIRSIIIAARQVSKTEYRTKIWESLLAAMNLKLPILDPQSIFLDPPECESKQEMKIIIAPKDSLQ